MTLSSRKDVTKMVRRVRGKRAARLVGQLQHAQLELGLACSRRGRPAEQDVEDARRTIRLLRVELAQQGVVRAGRSGLAGAVAAPRAALRRAAHAGQAVGATGADSSPPRQGLIERDQLETVTKR